MQLISLTFRGWRHTPQARAGKCRPALFRVFLFYPFGICPDRTPGNLRILFYWFGRRLIAWPGSVRELLNRAGAASDTERCTDRTPCTSSADGRHSATKREQREAPPGPYACKYARIRRRKRAKNVRFRAKNDQKSAISVQKSHAFSIKKRMLSAGNNPKHNRGGPCVILYRTRYADAKRPHECTRRG